MRLDSYLFSKGLVVSRTRAATLIKLGGVTINGKVETRSSYDVKDEDEVKVDDVIGYASVGGLKLAYALKIFRVETLGVCVDLGSSNGGFCDVLLQNGAEKVYAVDVGECALPDRLKNDPAIVVKDRTNARNTLLEDAIADTVTADLSFISLTLILPEVLRLLKKGGQGILLIKPQFEVGKNGLTKTGIVKSEKIALKSVERVKDQAIALGFIVLDVKPIERLFEDKNVEYLLYVKK